MIGIIEKERSMQNLINDLDDVSSMFESVESESNVTLPSHSSSILSMNKRLIPHNNILTNNKLAKQTQGDRRISQSKYKLFESNKTNISKKQLQVKK